MSIWTMLSSLVIGPLKMLFELIFSLAHRVLSPGGSIVLLSLCINLLVLPLYRRADAIQDAEREAERRLAPGVEHIRSVFRGDERFMILQTYYRQNHYSQAHALKGLLPLLLEIPFFIAAYQFLSGLSLLNRASFGPIRDLGVPDGLLIIGGSRLNVLPILMTIINIVSSEIYLRGEPFKNKIQLYAMALVFLVLLYESPAGLVIYWTLNNLFSLVKNLIVRFLPQREKTLSLKKIRRNSGFGKRPSPALFFLAAGVAALLTGGLIPSAVIAASPSEFVEVGNTLHPFWYIANSLLLAAGAFMIWPGIYYLLGSDRMKKTMEAGIWMLAGCMVVSYMVFHAGFGLLSPALQWERSPEFTWGQKLLNLGALVLTAGICLLIDRWREGLVRGICLTGAAAMLAMTVVNGVQSGPVISNAIVSIESGNEETPVIPLSKKGENVVVMMLDRAISSFIPAIFSEKPELKKTFDGFVYYPNTLSHGGYTNFGTPGLFGGYEYTPWELNQRSDELLSKKQDEALLVMPTIFSEAGYNVTVFDPPYAGNYTAIPDLSIYDGLENVHAYMAEPYFRQELGAEEGKQFRFRNFFSYALCETAPWMLYGTFYDWGKYNDPNERQWYQVQEEISTATGTMTSYFFSAYELLNHLNDITEIRDDTVNTLFLMDSNLTHEPALLQTPDYVMDYTVDNTDYDAAHADRFWAGPVPLNITDGRKMAYYHVTMAALLRVGKWLDYLQESGVYDHTRMILVSDHGSGLRVREDTLLENGTDLMLYNAFLMIKDFDSHGEIRTDPAFMTNADTPTLAMADLLENPVNPFTGKEINGARNKRMTQIVTTSDDFDTLTNKGYTFSKSDWYEVTEEALTPQKWVYLGEY